jgi:site-specific DNA recombinase
MRARTAALYARVSSQQQEERGTIASQVSALQQYAAEHDYLVPEEWIFQDEGYSGALLVRPGLEQLRDLAAQGELEVVLAYSPDRLARKYAYQVLLVEEFARSGVEVVFLKSSRGDSPEDELLLQFQGMIAEYERAQIAERTRRGKIHRARSGDASVLGGAPYGYRYVRKTDTTAGHYEIIESEAQVVRKVFRLYTRENYSMGALARHLSEEGVRTRTGKSRWDRSVIWAMLRNPAYVGRAAFGKTQVANRPKKLTRPIRRRGGVVSPHPAVEDRPPEAWIEIPVPAIIDETTFVLAAEQLERNKQFACRNTKELTLLQGLLVCRQCGYAYYRTSTRTTKRRIYYYRCLGSDDYRWEGGRVCSSRPVRQDHVDGVVWDAVIELLADPALVRQELERRLQERRRSGTSWQQKERLRREVARHQKAVTRLIEAYQEELISLEELRARIPELRGRQSGASAQLEALEAQLIDQEAYLKLAESLESFLSRLQERAQTLSVEERQKVLRLVVKEVQVDDDRIVIRHSIAPTDADPGSGYRLRGRGHKACPCRPLRIRRPCAPSGWPGPGRHRRARAHGLRDAPARPVERCPRRGHLLCRTGPVRAGRPGEGERCGGGGRCGRGPGSEQPHPGPP